MEEDQGRASPPLPSRGTYNIDFDALDDSFNPFESKKDIRHSPPPCSKSENAMENAPACGDGDVPSKEPVETPRKKKSKSHSSKRASGVIEGDSVSGLTDSQGAGEGLEDPSGATAVVVDKPVKPRKVVKKSKSRPSSKNLEGQGTPEKPSVLEGPSASMSQAPADDTETKPLQSTSAGEVKPQDTTTLEESIGPESEKTTENKENSLQCEENLLQHEKTSLQTEKFQHETTPEKTLSQSESNLPLEKTPSQLEKPSPSTGAEDSVDSPPKREKSSGKVKKTKVKVKKSSSSPRRSAVDGDVDKHVRHSEEHAPAAETDKESTGSPRVSSQGDTFGSHDSSVESDVLKSKHPAARALEQQVRDDFHSQTSAKNNLPHDSEDDFYDAFESPPSMTMNMVDQMQSYSDMNDSCTLFQSHDDLGGLTWSQEESTLLDEGAGEAAFAEDLTIGESDMADSHSTESVVKLVQVLKYSQSDWNKLRQELELNFQAQLLAKEKEWSAKLADRDARLTTLEDTNKKLRQTNEDMRTVMGEFEKTIGQLQSEKEKTSNASQQSLQDVVKERDQALEDLQSVETAFSDLHRRYEKTKGVVDGFKQNEEVLKKCVQDLQTKLKKTEQKVQTLKEQAEEKLERATEEIEKTQKSSASEIAKLEAALRKAEVQVQSMESSLEQKVKENKELAAICDELIAKVQ